MKTIFRMMLIVLLAGVASCSDEEEETVRTLEVSYVNLNGTWQLAEWKGQPLEEGAYCYITFSRRDKTFKMYQKFDSMYARCITGKFAIEKDDYLGYIISGSYDFGNGDWNNEYIVTDLLESGSMIWTVKENKNDTSKYVRCDGVPDSVVDEAREEF